MSRKYSPTVRRRRLSAVLRHLRHEHGKTLEEVTAALEWSRGRLAHMEGNKWTRPDLGNIRQLLDYFEVRDDATREAILELARQSRTKGWWAKFKDVFGGSSFVGFESEASVISTYQPIVIPGLLQTERYAAASARAALARPADEVDRIVEARLARQEILHGEHPPTIWAVIDESTLHRLPAAEGIAQDQLRHLITQAEDPDNAITIQVLPFSAGLHPGLSGPFVLLDFPDEMDAPLVYLETRTEGLFLEEEAEVAEYRHVFDHLQVTARSQLESIRMMKKMLADL
ncbi:helix-turn-helix transcriptional regulator [Nocardiopsis sp. FIRDI 009]|uniref:helix-turn-helix domain-containing protein n=1 Tax=Nocardiopsis sp. FIRDI 009 TaxID=714197 RepID=UPI000E27708C|nr:helix-turn-helix transcriptional regulator [Nocardiopsis sp. FIRDI 009]